MDERQMRYEWKNCGTYYQTLDSEELVRDRPIKAKEKNKSEHSESDFFSDHNSQNNTGT